MMRALFPQVLTMCSFLLVLLGEHGERAMVEASDLPALTIVIGWSEEFPFIELVLCFEGDESREN